MKQTIIAIMATLLLLPVAPARAAVPALAVPALDSKAMAFVSIPVAHLRAKPAHSAEMVSQALLGTPVRINAPSGEWFAVTLPDGYDGYIHTSSVKRVSGDDFAVWKASPRVMATVPATVDVVADTVRGKRLTYMVNGTVVIGDTHAGSGYFRVTLPDGIDGYIPADAAVKFGETFSSRTDTDEVLATATLALGAPYLWGGTTLLAPDCSGLVRRAYFSVGILLPRDAWQQALTGIAIPVDRPDLWKRGDLLFYKNKSGKVSHVAIYDRKGRYIHSAGKVFNASIYPYDSMYINRKVALVVRVAGCEDTPGIVRLTSHPWYF